jgi:hypothetical protein
MRCKCCLQLQHAQVFHSKTTGKEYNIFCNVNCKTPTAFATHGLHWPTVDKGLDTAALTSVSFMLFGRRNATMGGSGNNLASISLFSILTPNVVYLLDCHVCGSQYVGESVQPFNKRMNGHRSDLTKKTLLPVSQHF